MKSFFQWFTDSGIDPNRPWLILGKGPSFASRNGRDLECYHTMSLNHVVREQPVTVAHMIDFDVVDACGESLLNNAQVVVLPWVPHVNNRPGRNNLAELAQIHPLLRRINEQGRLLWYNHSKARQRNGDSPVVRVRFFSAVAALNLLALAGVHTIRSLGVDGGTSYSKEFDDLKEKTLLANSRSSFDRQFEEIANTIATTGIDYAPLNIASPVRIYIGATDREMLPVKVLEYSIRKHASMSVEVMPLHHSGIAIPLPKNPKNQPRTPFSFQRFLIPALTGYHGRAIYLDSDMQLFKDIRLLWATPFNGADLLTVCPAEASERRPQFSVMILNCETLDWDVDKIVRLLDEDRLSYEQLLYQMALVKNIRTDIGAEWNALEYFSAGDTALLHFTDMSTQPWVSRENHLGYLWVGDLIEAIDAKAVSMEFLQQEIATGHVRPSLLYQVENRLSDSLLLPRKAKQMDAKFVPPYQSVAGTQKPLWFRSGRRLRALFRHYYRNNRAYHYQRIFYDWLYR
jgi:hypothetical protein